MQSKQSRWFQLLAFLSGLVLFSAHAGTSAATLAQNVLQDTAVTPNATPVSDPRFGAIESFWAPQEAAELGVGWERILFYWNEIQPKDADDWNTLHVLEEWLVEANAQDRVVIGLLKNTPAWATDGDPFSGVPRGLYLPHDDPNNLWANYIRRVVAYYAPRGVHNWIVWNEPEIKKGVYGHEFSGSVEDYYQLLKVAYLVAKEMDPQAVIHLAGWSYWHDPDYLRQFLKVAAADPTAIKNEYYFDLISLHIYFRVETVSSLVQEVDRIQNSFDVDKPIWINETNASPNLNPWWPVKRPVFQVDLDQQAWYVVQAHALGFGAGAESIGVYKLIDILLPDGGESFGILRPDYSKRPAYLAYKTVIEQLRGFNGPAQIQTFPDYFLVNFPLPDGVTRILWTRKARTITLAVPALAETAVIVDALGQEEQIAADDGYYEITLEGARCEKECEIGGPPLFLVEKGITLSGYPPIPRSPLEAATVTPLPEITATFTPWPTNTPTPTSTYTPTPTWTPTQTPSPTLTPTATPTITPPPTTTTANTATATPSATAVTTTNSTTPQSETGFLLGISGLLGAALLGLYFVRRKNQ